MGTLGDEAEMTELTTLQQQLWRLTKQLHEAKEQCQYAQIDSLGEQIRHAWNANDHSLVRRLARRLATAAVGPGRRFYNTPTLSNPTVDMWKQHMAQPGWQGGQSA
eukprot:418634-Pyramimonas_sp.AAC.1